MDEQAELILNGDICQVCGVDMNNGSGFPRTCSGCLDRDNEDEKL